MAGRDGLVVSRADKRKRRFPETLRRTPRRKRKRDGGGRNRPQPVPQSNGHGGEGAQAKLRQAEDRTLQVFDREFSHWRGLRWLVSPCLSLMGAGGGGGVEGMAGGG